MRGHSKDLIEACLAHISGDSVRNAYNKSTYLTLRELMQKMGELCGAVQKNLSKRESRSLSAFFNNPHTLRYLRPSLRNLLHSSSVLR